MLRLQGVTRGAAALLPILLLAAACAPSAAPAPTKPAPAPSPSPAGGAPAVAASAAPAAAAAATSGKPSLSTSPAVELKVGVLPLASFGPYYIAGDRGYYQEAGLNVELVTTSNVNEQLPAITQGQIQVGACASSAGCFNALNRRTDIQIVADLQSAGKTEKSRGNSALVVRKDLYDAGLLHQPRDFVGHSIYVIAGPGSGSQAQGARWLRRAGVDPMSVEWPQMFFPDQLLAMLNGGIEAGIQTEPLVGAGLARGAHQIVATQEEMDPETQILYSMMWTGIDRVGPQVGERFMVAYLRAVRDYLNAFEYGTNADEIISSLTEHTAIKDPAIYRQIKYAWVDPNGEVKRPSLESDAELFRELGVVPTAIDLSGAFNDKYRQFAVDYLGPYQPPR